LSLLFQEALAAADIGGEKRRGKRKTFLDPSPWRPRKKKKKKKGGRREWGVFFSTLRATINGVSSSFIFRKGGGNQQFPSYPPSMKPAYLLEKAKRGVLPTLYQRPVRIEKRRRTPPSNLLKPDRSHDEKKTPLPLGERGEGEFFSNYHTKSSILPIRGERGGGGRKDQILLCPPFS